MGRPMGRRADAPCPGRTIAHRRGACRNQSATPWVQKKYHHLRLPRALSLVTALAKKEGTLKQQSPEGGTAFPGGGPCGEAIVRSRRASLQLMKTGKYWGRRLKRWHTWSSQRGCSAEK